METESLRWSKYTFLTLSLTTHLLPTTKVLTVVSTVVVLLLKCLLLYLLGIITSLPQVGFFPHSKTWVDFSEDSQGRTTCGPNQSLQVVELLSILPGHLLFQPSWVVQRVHTCTRWVHLSLIQIITDILLTTKRTKGLGEITAEMEFKSATSCSNDLTHSHATS